MKKLTLVVTILTVVASHISFAGTTSSRPGGRSFKASPTSTLSTRSSARLPTPGRAGRPSQRVTELIRERGGTGLLGTALLISLLSRDDLSSSDRAWISRKLKASGDEGYPIAQAPEVEQPVTFRYSGLKQENVASSEVLITVQAFVKGRLTPTVCEVGEKQFRGDGEQTTVRFNARQPGAFLLECTAEGFASRRLLRIRKA